MTSGAGDANAHDTRGNPSNKHPESHEHALAEALRLILIAEGPAKMAAMTLAEQHPRGLSTDTFRISEAAARNGTREAKSASGQPLLSPARSANRPCEPSPSRPVRSASGLSLVLPDYVDRDLDRRDRSSVLEPVCGVPILGPAHSRPIIRGDSISMVSDRSLQHVDDAWSAFMVVNGPKTPPGSMVTIRIRSWCPAMPSISGPRSTVASNSAVTPFVSGTACSLLMVFSFSCCLFVVGTGDVWRHGACRTERQEPSFTV
jgi:hypothetical protein